MSAAPPLARRRVVVTRGIEKGDELPRLLEDAGATVVRVPLITPVALVSEARVRAALDRLHETGAPGSATPWVVVTSETAAGLLAPAARAGALGGLSAAAVGPATARALCDLGVEAALVATGQEAESLAAELIDAGVAGSRVLVVAAAGGRNVVAPALTRSGADVEVLEAYRTVMPGEAVDALRAAFAAAPVDAVTFTSGSTVRHFARAIPVPPRDSVAACIGPVTAVAAREAGWEHIVAADTHTAAGLAAAVITRFGGVHPLP